MIATLVSTENACPYCADSHACFFRVYGGSAEALAAIREGRLDAPALTDQEQALLAFARKVNRESSAIGRADVESLCNQGWNEDQVAEAIHVAALFATFNRVANSFGLVSQGLLDIYEKSATA